MPNTVDANNRPKRREPRGRHQQRQQQQTGLSLLGLLGSDPHRTNRNNRGNRNGGNGNGRDEGGNENVGNGSADEDGDIKMNNDGSVFTSNLDLSAQLEQYARSQTKGLHPFLDTPTYALAISALKKLVKLNMNEVSNNSRISVDLQNVFNLGNEAAAARLDGNFFPFLLNVFVSGQLCFWFVENFTVFYSKNATFLVR